VKYIELKKEIADSRTIVNASKGEEFDTARVGFVLSVVCATSWTGLVGYYIVMSFVNWKWDQNSPFPIINHPSTLSVGLCLFEVMSKIWYFSVLVDAYEKVFDEKSRVVRRLEEIRYFMSAVWESSSDIIIFCGHRQGRINARVSPAFLKMLGLDTGRMSFLDRGDVSLVLDIDPTKNEYSVFAVDLSKQITRQDVNQIKISLTRNTRTLGAFEGLTQEEKNVAVVALLVTRALKSLKAGNASNLMTEFLSKDESGKVFTRKCEAKIATVDDNNVVLVLRDISDRIQRFEAEKKLVKEITTRQKDAETNKFSRHEIKNGILSALAILDHIRENVNLQLHTRKDIVDDNSKPEIVFDAGEGCAISIQSNISAKPDRASESDFGFSELESTLRDIMDTMLDEAMAREIVYGDYQPRRERMKVEQVLASLRRRDSPRFPMELHPERLPDFALDRHLIRYIYRNAVSNACKYGRHNGIVKTVLKYDSKNNTFCMEVINEPGDGHEELARLSQVEVDAVFHPGSQLSATRVVVGKSAQLVRNESSGNGAWIMQRCAQTLGGLCSIRFETNRTVFSLKCPVDAFPEEKTFHGSISEIDESFCLPEGTWGIVLDDSSIQRKLMDRFLKMAGIEDSRRKIYGKDADEVFGFCDTVCEFMKNNPKDKFILIVDENLDIVGGGARQQTVSGSLCVDKLRKQLGPQTEKRLLALIRSANDSLSDIEIYKTRAHGYLLKEPIKKGGVLEVIRPWWIQRFRLDRSISKIAMSNLLGDELYFPSSEDIVEALDVIRALLSVDDDEHLASRWCMIQENLQRLKGDLKTRGSEESLLSVVDRIDRLIDSKELPAEFVEHWENIESQVRLLTR